MIRQNWRQFDWLLFLAILITSVFGVIMIHSAVQGDPELVDFPQRQAIYVAVGVVIMFLVSSFNYYLLRTLTIPFYIVVMVLLVLVGTLGQTLFGAQSWLDFFGLFPIQPSELAKVALAMALGSYLARNLEHIGEVRVVLTGVLITLPILVLVAIQPDLGTAVVLAVEAAFIFFVAGLYVRYMVAGAFLALLSAPLAWNMLAEHQRTRILIFIDPTADPDAFFNVKQALVGVGSGGLLGKGYGQGTQSQLHFLRVRHTDFIFSVIAEELGFVGAAILLFLLFFIIWRLWRIVDRADEPFGKLLVAGLTSVILFQTMVVVGMNMGLLPVTGLPLPFVSYGGNAMLSLMIFIGLAQSVAMRRG
ncbi:MAG TPA: rod shape-determining protein RodA [Anaerolineae bacterium]|nr:rod shape-determining protein RodA [Anaerolineae bacterium]